MYTISRAAEQVGISASTLRAWERRYSVVTPQRTDGAYRVYSNDDLRVLQVMKQLVNTGWTPALAAKEALRLVPAVPRDAPSERPDAVAPPAADQVSRQFRLSEEFVAAAGALNASRLDELLDEMFAAGGFEMAASSYLFPALEALGAAWESGGVTVAGEHLASHAVGRRLAAAYDAAARADNGARVLIGLAPGSRHELGLLAFAVAARRVGLRTDYLGADVPVADWLAACSQPRVEAVVLAIRAARDVAPMAKVAAAVHRHHPDLLIAVGGARQEKAPPGVLRLGDDFAQAARTLAQAVAA